MVINGSMRGKLLSHYRPKGFVLANNIVMLGRGPGALSSMLTALSDIRMSK